MSERYRAVVDLTYPTPASLKTVEKKGGLTAMSQEDLQKITLKQVKAGAYATDIPEKSIKWLLKQGLIKKVGATSAKGKGKK
jgi:hypothetical protein